MDRTAYEIENYRALDTDADRNTEDGQLDPISAGDMEMYQDHDTQILANLNILKENMIDNPKY